jgi:hypothetical protein
MGTEEVRPQNPLMRLEQTFTGYVASLQGRKGQFNARALLNRSSADELAVNDLYNRLIESPFDLDASSDLPAEVIFVAFEKFARIAWKEQMGPIMTTQALDALQVRASKRVPGDFADFVNYLFGDMAPQNRRAFTALIKLLSDLLDGCGNDGDRGALTLAFAELLVENGPAHDYINLLDRLVVDCDRIFEEAGFGASVHFRGSAYESMNSVSRGQKSATGSMSSNTSSLRRKLGFENLLRPNAKQDQEKPSMWRSLSKHGRNPATGESASLSKASAMRARSIDMGMHSPGAHTSWRPGSRDRPPVSGAFDEIPERPASSHRLETATEQEDQPTDAKSLKKKRRSSLSDLKALMAATTLEETPLMPLRINKQMSEKFNSSPKSNSPSKIPVNPAGQSLRPPLQQKENIAFGDDVVSGEKTHGKTLSMSQIPTLKASRLPGVASESPSRLPASPSKTATSQQKLRLQSPQKLRERLQAEKNAVDEVDASVKTELSRIAQDVSRVNSSLTHSATGDLAKLSEAVRTLEARIPQLMQDLQDRQAEMQRDMEASLKASEAKVKAIDQLYKETTAENELLYEKFNNELGKIVKALRGKGREDKEELLSKLKDSGEESARLKKENARLKREIVSLKTLLKGGDN